MGYLCPVCAAPFGGGEPLADHLAVSAILHGGDHEAWLDDTVDDWGSISRADLGERVVDHAEETDDHEHIGEHSHRDPEPASGLPNGIDAPEDAAVDGDAALDGDAQAVLREARELTQEMQGDERSESDDERKES
ncbi:hypothetical protein EGH24_01485 [Halonotius terrestris]|uniref:Uncharacterized protein n=1 Tax=Halonotius terrestris TaxID=2487750 RepID=A0A8J8PE70_9EURY|nr:DUF5810 domain-containing protein [Halonotius terrestris]TQQ83491.1 hypothetical protein EGH24_01485 [Halonotius terrestris]